MNKRKIFIKGINHIKYLKYKEIMNNIINVSPGYRYFENSDVILFPKRY